MYFFPFNEVYTFVFYVPLFNKFPCVSHRPHNYYFNLCVLFIWKPLCYNLFPYHFESLQTKGLYKYLLPLCIIVISSLVCEVHIQTIQDMMLICNSTFIDRIYWWGILTTIRNEETFLRDFLVILKHSLQNF